MVYFDTCVLVAGYCTEPHSQDAEAALQERDIPHISHLVQAEFCSAIAKDYHRGTLTRAGAQKTVVAFQEHITEDMYAFLPVDAVEYLMARDFMARFEVPLRTLDALHLAVAFANNATLVTIDQALGKAAIHFGVDCDLLT